MPISCASNSFKEVVSVSKANAGFSKDFSPIPKALLANLHTGTNDHWF